MSRDISSRSAAGSDRPPLSEASRFRRNMWIMALFALPVIYLGIILSVSIHEAIGHGVLAALLGGEFKGFGVLLDGMGWANVEIDALSTLRQALVYLGGGLSTTIFSLLFFALSLLFRKNYFLTSTFLFWGMTNLADGLPYFFWDAIRPGGIGDFSMIWLLYPSQALRITTIGLCGLLLAAGIALFNVQYYKIVYAWLGAGRLPDRKEKIIVSLVIFLLQVLAWCSFDWEQLVPGIGLLPSLTALAITLAALILMIAFYKGKRSTGPRPETSQAKMPVFIAWVTCSAVVFLILQWLQKGIVFS